VETYRFVVVGAVEELLWQGVAEVDGTPLVEGAFGVLIAGASNTQCNVLAEESAAKLAQSGRTGVLIARARRRPLGRLGGQRGVRSLSTMLV